MKSVSSNIDKEKLIFLQPKNMPLKIHKLLKMTYNDSSECLVKEKGVESLEYTVIIKRRSGKWNLE